MYFGATKKIVRHELTAVETTQLYYTTICLVYKKIHVMYRERPKIIPVAPSTSLFELIQQLKINSLI